MRDFHYFYKYSIFNIFKNVVDDELKYDDYKNILFNRPYMRHEMNKIQIISLNIEN